jgi:hypothetical protein
MTMKDPIDDKLKSVCHQLPRHAPGKSLWPGVHAAISPRKARVRWPVIFVAAAGVLAAALALVFVSPKQRRPGLESGPSYEDVTSGPGDVYGESGRRGLPEGS